MSEYCPEWIFGICSAATAKEFLSSENSLNSSKENFRGLSKNLKKSLKKLQLVLRDYSIFI